MDRETKTTIYFIRDERTGWIKIGLTRDIDTRVTETASGRRAVSLLGIIKGGYAQERLLHKVFHPYRVRKTEWFKPNELLLDFIEREAVDIPKYKKVNGTRIKRPDSFPYVSVSDMTRIMGCSRTSVLTAISSGKIDAVRVGREWAAIKSGVEDPPEIVSVTQAAKELNLSDTRVRMLIEEGKLPAQRVGREWAILRPNLDWFASLDRPPGRPPKDERDTRRPPE